MVTKLDTIPTDEKLQHVPLDDLVEMARARHENTKSRDYEFAIRRTLSKAEPEDGLKIIEAWLGHFVNVYHGAEAPIYYKANLRFADKVLQFAFSHKEKIGKTETTLPTHLGILRLMDQYIRPELKNPSDVLPFYAYLFAKMVDKHAEPGARSLEKLFFPNGAPPEVSDSELKAKDRARRLFDEAKQYTRLLFGGAPSREPLNPQPPAGSKYYP